jgi:Polysaccharide lyase
LRKTFLLALLVCTAARASVVWRGDFETGDLSQWSSVDGLASRLTVTTSPVRQGAHALRTELRNGDFSNNGNRNELVWSEPQTEGMDRYYAWSTWFDVEYPSETTWQVFTQWHHTGNTGSPPLEMDVYAEELRLYTRGTTVLWSAPLVRGVWHDFILHVRWSADASVGFVELWHDGVKVLDRKTLATLYAGQSALMKQGLYRDSSIVPTAVVFHDGMTVATALSDVLPPAADAGTPAPDAGVATTDAGSTPIATVPDAGTGAVSGDGVQPPPVASTSLAPTSAFPAPGCSSAGTGAFAALGIASLLARRARRNPRRYIDRPS